MVVMIHTLAGAPIYAGFFASERRNGSSLRVTWRVLLRISCLYLKS